MKKIIIIFTFLILSCSTTKLSKTESENLKTEFTEMYKIDQIAQAGKPNGEFKNYPLENWHKFKDSVFTKNKNRVEYLFKKYGYLGINEIGKNASNNFWILVQHSDKFPEFQKNVLKSMKKSDECNIDVINQITGKTVIEKFDLEHPDFSVEQAENTDNVLKLMTTTSETEKEQNVD